MEENNNGIITDFEELFPDNDSLNIGDVKEWEEQDRKQESQKGISEDKVSTGTRRKQSPRIAVSLASNLSASVVPYSQLEEMFLSSDRAEWTREDGQTVKVDLKRDVLKDTEPQGIQDKNFKPVRLTNQEQKLCYALSYLLTIETESPQLTFLIDETERGSEDPLFVPLDINASIVSKIMTGESRTRYKNTVGELLKSISQKIQVFKCQAKQNGKNKTLLFSFPLVVSKGFVEEAVTDKDGNPTKNFIGMKAELLRPFFDNIRKKNIPINPTLFKLWIDSDLFANLFSKLNELWFYSWVGFHKAEAEVLQKYGNIKGADKISEIEEEIQRKKYASITRTLDFDTIMNLDEDDHKSDKFRRLRFKKELEKCMKRFIQYGIITDKSHILPDKKQAVFVFNMSFKGETDGRVIELKG